MELVLVVKGRKKLSIFCLGKSHRHNVLGNIVSGQYCVLSHLADRAPPSEAQNGDLKASQKVL